MTKAKKIKPILFIILMSFIFIIGFTYAYFYLRGTFANKFKTSAYDVELSEEFNNDWGTKKVNILNKDNTPVVIRINYNELWSEREKSNDNILTSLNDNNIGINTNTCRSKVYSEDPKKYTLSNIINGEDVVTKNWTSTWHNFIKGSDGWYYYNSVLTPNSSIQILESISLRNDLISKSNCYEDYNDYEYELSFNYEVIQANENAIKDIWGLNVSINEGDIIWPF